eukprot:403368063
MGQQDHITPSKSKYSVNLTQNSQTDLKEQVPLVNQNLRNILYISENKQPERVLTTKAQDVQLIKDKDFPL